MWLLNSKEPVPHTLGMTRFVTRPVGERIQLAFRRGAGANLQLYQHLDTQSSLNIQDFEEQPNALLASIQCMEKRKGLATSSDSKATGESKECRQMCCDTDLCLPYIFCSS